MSRRRKTIGLAVAFVVLLSADAAADPLPEVVQVTESVTLTADDGRTLRVPPGYYVPAPSWDAIDLAMKRLQDTRTRLTAENSSLRASASGGFGWGTVLSIAGAALAAGIVAGAVTY